ncbi:MAG: coenzyme F420-0:L-glutamate ligase [Thermomicrobiales bacterium]|nr:coenzyme F420-0:L-glutamate ligase [Thermomicrobiales bacterium]
MSETTREVRLVGLDGIPEIHPGDDLAALLGEAIERSGVGLLPGDVLVVTHKVVSKAEGRLVRLGDVEPSPFALQIAAQHDKDPRQVEVVLRESRRIVRMDHGVLVTETTHGFTCANAGVDASNVDTETICLLPLCPDASAAGLRQALMARFGLREGDAFGVIVTDSWGRPWRRGIVNFAIGVAGLAPLIDYRGHHDAAGYELHVTVLAVADELAAASELVMHKLAARPAALVRGYAPPIAAEPGTGQDLILDPARDLFR